MNSLNQFDDSFIEGIETRFWEKVAKKEPSDCWLWLGAKSRKGYGSFIVDGRRNVEGARKSIGTHRLSWILAFGSIPDSLHVLHRCDTPACVNPSHLFLGTNLDNHNDKVNKGRVRTRITGPFPDRAPRHSTLPMPSSRLDLTQKRFGILTAIEKSGKDARNNILWKCLCDCGSYKNVAAANLNKGWVRSCGCVKPRFAKVAIK